MILRTRVSAHERSQYGLVFFPNLGGKITIPVVEWMESGPPAVRPLYSPMYAVHLETGAQLPVRRVLPLRFRNTRWSRRLIRWGVLKPPKWHTPYPLS